MPKTCSQTAISHRTNKPIHGIAAMLQNMSDAGGPDAYMKNLAFEAGKAGGKAVIAEMDRRELVKQRRHLKSVAWFNQCSISKTRKRILCMRFFMVNI